MSIFNTVAFARYTYEQTSSSLVWSLSHLYTHGDFLVLGARCLLLLLYAWGDVLCFSGHVKRLNVAEESISNTVRQGWCSTHPVSETGSTLVVDVGTYVVDLGVVFGSDVVNRKLSTIWMTPFEARRSYSTTLDWTCLHLKNTPEDEENNMIIMISTLHILVTCFFYQAFRKPKLHNLPRTTCDVIYDMLNSSNNCTDMKFHEFLE